MPKYFSELLNVLFLFASFLDGFIVFDDSHFQNQSRFLQELDFYIERWLRRKHEEYILIVCGRKQIEIVVFVNNLILSLSNCCTSIIFERKLIVILDFQYFDRYLFDIAYFYVFTYFAITYQKWSSYQINNEKHSWNNPEKLIYST